MPQPVTMISAESAGPCGPAWPGAPCDDSVIRPPAKGTSGAAGWFTRTEAGGRVRAVGRPSAGQTDRPGRSWLGLEAAAAQPDASPRTRRPPFRLSLLPWARPGPCRRHRCTADDRCRPPGPGRLLVPCLQATPGPAAAGSFTGGQQAPHVPCTSTWWPCPEANQHNVKPPGIGQHGHARRHASCCVWLHPSRVRSVTIPAPFRRLVQPAGSAPPGYRILRIARTACHRCWSVPISAAGGAS